MKLGGCISLIRFHRHKRKLEIATPSAVAYSSLSFLLAENQAHVVVSSLPPLLLSIALATSMCLLSQPVITTVTYQKRTFFLVKAINKS